MEEENKEFKQKRHEFSINIRRQNRQEIINKRRHPPSAVDLPSQSRSHSQIVDARLESDIEKKQINHARLETEPRWTQQIETYFQMLRSQDPLSQIQAIIFLRILAGSGKSTFIEQLMKKGIISLLYKFVHEDDPKLKYQAIWMLSILTQKDKICKLMVNEGFIPVLVGMVGIYDDRWDEHLFTILGNITIESVKYRDIILKQGVVDKICNAFNSAKREEAVETLLWSLNNLGRGSPPPNYQYFDCSIPILCSFLKNPRLQQIETKQTNTMISNTLWVLSGYTSLSKTKIRANRLIEQGIIPLLFQHAKHPQYQIYTPAIKIIGNFSSLSKMQTQVLLDNNILDLCLSLLSHEKQKMRREASWIISNIAAGPNSQIESLLTRRDLMDKISEVFATDVWEVQYEICWIYANLTYYGGKSSVVDIFIHYGIVGKFVRLLDDKANSDFLKTALKTLKIVMHLGNLALRQGKNVLLLQFIESGGVAKLQALQQHPLRYVYNETILILQRFFEVE